MTRDPAYAALLIYMARTAAARCMASTALRDLRRDPGNGILRRRLADCRARFCEWSSGCSQHSPIEPG